MSSPSQYIADRLPWLTRSRAAAGAFVLALLIVFIWPNARMVVDLVIFTAVPGLIGAVVWGLTFWSKARTQIGRRQLRYKAVRRVAGVAALACLPFVLTQRAAIYLRSPREVASQVSEAYPDMKEWRAHIVVAIAHLEGDDGAKIEARLHDALDGFDRRLHITPVILNRTIAISGRPQGIAHLDALGAVTDVRFDSLIWGGTKGAAHPAVGPLYATSFGPNSQFGGAYLPDDFKLPELPLDDLCTVLRLIVATHTAEYLHHWMIKFGDALEPLIKQVRAMADDPRKTSGWSADARARVNLAIGIALETSGAERESVDSIQLALVYFQRTQADWTRERDPLEWAMAQENLGSALRDLSRLNLQIAPLQKAATNYQNALAVYQSRSDRLDSANLEYILGVTFEKIADHETGVENLHRAVDYYRAGVSGIDVRYYPVSWAEAERGLGNTLQLLASRDGKPKGYEDAIAADREALKIYDKQSWPIYWAATQEQIVHSLAQLAYATNSRDDFKQSIALCQEILDGYPRETNAMVWAEIHIDLGNALVGLSGFDKDSEAENLQQAAIAFRAALQELSIEHYPTDWATAKTGLGNALLLLGQNGSDTFYAQQAVDAFNDALKVLTPEQEPVAWAWAKYDLGDALVQIGERGSGVRYLEQGVDTYHQALSVVSKDKSPELWNDIQRSLAVALDDLHRRGSKSS
jgi:tetratricopeptide (TPR) repeat protein